MTTFLSPGAYANEVDLSTYAARIASTVLALVGTASKGPVGVPTLLTSQANGANVFGKPMAIGTSKARFGLHAAMNALSQTSQVWYTRITDGTEAFASADTPIVVNSQVLYLAKDDAGITILGGQLAFALQVFKRGGTFLGSDAFDALVRRFGANNIFDSSFAPITNLQQLNDAIDSDSAFVQVNIPMASATKTFENYDQFTNRFNRLMVDAPLRAENILVEDDVNGVQKYIAIRTANLADLVALNLEFMIIDDTTSVSPAETGFATSNFDGGTPYSQLQFTAKKPGIAGNGIVVDIVDVGNTFIGLPPVSVSGRTITVSINNGVTTANEVVTSMMANTTARLIVTAENGAGSDGSGLIAVGTTNLVNGGSNLPTVSIVNPVSESIGTINLSTSHTQRLDYSSSLKLHFKASSPGSYANAAKMYFGHDDSGLQTIEYRETNELGEKAINLRIQPSGVKGSFIDAVEAFNGVSPLSADDITGDRSRWHRRHQRHRCQVVPDLELLRVHLAECRLHWWPERRAGRLQ